MKWVDYRNKILAELDYEDTFRQLLKDNNIINNGTEWKVSCPVGYQHEHGYDTNPSCTVNVSKGVFFCNVCGFKGNVHTLVKTVLQLSSEEAWFLLGDGLGIERPSTSVPTRPDIEVGLVAKYHTDLMKLTGPLRDVLKTRRGLNNETLKRFAIGWNGDRVTIPVYDEFSNLVNFRLYKWNSDEDRYKVINYEDDFGNKYGEARIFGIENLVDDSIDTVVWCEGEMDRLVAEQHGFPTVCATSGAGTWRAEWAKYVRKKKRIIIAQDNDEAGREATKRLCEHMHPHVNVSYLNWPEDFPNKGDITDFFTKCGMGAADFQYLIDNATEFTLDTDESTLADERDVPEVSLVAAGHAKWNGKRIKVPVLVSGKAEMPYVVPSKVSAMCLAAEEASNEDAKCRSCSLLRSAGHLIKKIGSCDKELLNMIDCSDDAQQVEIKKYLGVNGKCGKCEVTVLEKGNLEELRLVPKVDSSFGAAQDSDYVVRIGYSMTSNLKSNCKYTAVGYQVASPKNQAVTYMFDKLYPDKDVATEFEMSEYADETLKILQPAEGQSVVDKINEIHADLERNVTRVWERQDVAKAVDLVYHSVQSFYFQGASVIRGWVEALIIGDSGQAKSTLVENLMAHYGVGEKYSGESSKRTGLLYNMQQNKGKWFLVWGALPLNDGGLVTIDELSGLSEEDLAQFSDVRSSGRAKATGVVTTETNARTRVIYISNPRNGKQLNTETYGVEAVIKLFGKAEDVRRLDMALSVASGDVDPDLVNRHIDAVPPVPHKITSEVRRLSVLWAWSRRPNDIVFTEGTTELILKKASEMGKKYSSAIPLVEAADQRIKIARLAIACACSLYSTDDGKRVLVTKEHVEYVVDFLTKIYSHRSLGYDRYSKDKLVNSDTSDVNITRLRKKFLALPIGNHQEMAKILYSLPYFNRNTLEDYTGLVKDDLRVLIKFLTNEHIVEKVRQDYRRYPLGTSLLQDLVNNPITKQELAEASKYGYSLDDQ